jgi:hypothetical protein
MLSMSELGRIFVDACNTVHREFKMRFHMFETWKLFNHRLALFQYYPCAMTLIQVVSTESGKTPAWNRGLSLWTAPGR